MASGAPSHFEAHALLSACYTSRIEPGMFALVAR
jgi:hypothetical protein